MKIPIGEQVDEITNAGYDWEMLILEESESPEVKKLVNRLYNELIEQVRRDQNDA